MAHKNRSNWTSFRRSTAPTGHHRKPSQIYSQPDAEVRLRDLFFNHGLPDLTGLQVSKLAAYYRLLLDSQQHQNFTRLLTLREIALKHFVDSLIITRHAKLRFPLLDLGSGPGLPGIPLKILFPDEQILLAEGVQKRVEFLRHVRDSLELPNLDIIGRNIDKHFAYPVYGVITRAVEDIGNTLRNISTCLQTTGRVYFMKGPNVDSEIEATRSQWPSYYKVVEDIAYDLPHTSHQRRLLVFERLAHD